jgi:hypothetical protein
MYSARSSGSWKPVKPGMPLVRPLIAPLELRLRLTISSPALYRTTSIFPASAPPKVELLYWITPSGDPLVPKS